MTKTIARTEVKLIELVGKNIDITNVLPDSDDYGHKWYVEATLSVPTRRDVYFCQRATPTRNELYVRLAAHVQEHGRITGIKVAQRSFLNEQGENIVYGELAPVPELDFTHSFSHLQYDAGIVTKESLVDQSFHISSAVRKEGSYGDFYQVEVVTIHDTEGKIFLKANRSTESVIKGLDTSAMYTLTHESFTPKGQDKPVYFYKLETIEDPIELENDEQHPF